jgi:hypothetical protein
MARIVLNSYILYKENYKGPGKLKYRYNYSVHNWELGEEWLALKDNAEADDPWGPQGLRKLRVLVHCPHYKGEEVERQTVCNKGWMQNASLNTGANCKKKCMHCFT